MPDIVNDDVEMYATKHSAEETSLFKKLAAETKAKTEYPGMQVGPLEGAFLRLLVRLVKARRVLEIGTFTGYSSLAMAEGLPAGGQLITCDIDPATTAIARAFWKKSPHGKKISLKLAPALDTLKTLKGPFDVVFIDADKDNYINYWNACVPKTRKGGLIIADNVLWRGLVLNPKDKLDYAIVNFNRRVSADSRVERVMLTVRDGMTLAWKK